MRNTNVQPLRRSINHDNKNIKWDKILRLSKNSNNLVTSHAREINISLHTKDTKGGLRNREVFLTKSGTSMAQIEISIQYRLLGYSVVIRTQYDFLPIKLLSLGNHHYKSK